MFGQDQPPLSALFFWETSVLILRETSLETCRSLCLSLGPFRAFHLGLFPSFRFQSLEMPGCQNHH